MQKKEKKESDLYYEEDKEKQFVIINVDRCCFRILVLPKKCQRSA